MFSRDLWGEIAFSISNNKLRTFLTGFSVAWGIFILVLLLASVEGMKNGFTKRFSKNASNSIFIRTNATTIPYGGLEAGRKITLKNSDIQFIAESFRGYYQYLSPSFNKSVAARYNNETGTYSVSAINTDQFKIDKTTLSHGRFINYNDVEKALKVMVIGKMVASDLFKKQDPIGKYILINNMPHKIVGVFSKDDDEREERKIYAPITTFQRIYGNTDEINQINLTYNPLFNFAKAIDFSDKLEHVFKRRYTIAPDDQGAITINNYAKRFSDLSNFTTMLSAISIGVGFLILISGIVGIGNIMVFIIKERTKEIGIRKALGATPFDIVKLVLLESMVITSASGFVGMLLAMSLVSSLAPLIDSPAFSNPSVNTSTVVTATLVLVLAGLVAGLIPAINAARVKPIVALRSK